MIGAFMIIKMGEAKVDFEDPLNDKFFKDYYDVSDKMSEFSEK